MSVEDLIKLLQARLAALNSARASAASVGDLAEVVRLDGDIGKTQLTLDQLLGLVA